MKNTIAHLLSEGAVNPRLLKIWSQVADTDPIVHEQSARAGYTIGTATGTTAGMMLILWIITSTFIDKPPSNLLFNLQVLTIFLGVISGIMYILASGTKKTVDRFISECRELKRCLSTNQDHFDLMKKEALGIMVCDAMHVIRHKRDVPDDPMDQGYAKATKGVTDAEQLLRQHVDLFHNFGLLPGLDIRESYQVIFEQARKQLKESNGELVVVDTHDS